MYIRNALFNFSEGLSLNVPKLKLGDIIAIEIGACVLFWNNQCYNFKNNIERPIMTIIIDLYKISFLFILKCLTFRYINCNILRLWFL